jgi:hypothetical protein
VPSATKTVSDSTAAASTAAPTTSGVNAR